MFKTWKDYDITAHIEYFDCGDIPSADAGGEILV